MTDQHYIGIVERLSSTTAWLQPLAFIDENGLPQEEELANNFPERGQVLWFISNNSVAHGSLWCFGVRESPTFDPAAGRYDRYTVAGTPEKLDRRIVAHFANAEAAREVLSIGIEAAFDQKDRAFVVVGKDHLIGPLQMEQHDGMIRLDPGHRDAPVNVSLLSKHHVVSLRSHERRVRLLWPPRASWSYDFQLDWDSDDAVLARGLRRMRDLASKQFVSDLGLTNSLISAVSTRIDSFNLSSLDRYRIERAQQLIREAGSDRAFAERVVREALELPAVRSSIDQATTSAVAQATSELKAHEAAVLGELRMEREHLEQQVSGLRVEVDATTTKLSAAREEVQRFLANVGQEIDTGMEELLKRPGEVIGRSAMLMAATGMLQDRQRTAKCVIAVPNRARELSPGDIRASLEQWAEHEGIESAQVIALAASLIAGNPTTISGDLSAQAVSSVKQALFGGPGNVLKLALNPGYLSPIDVLKDAGFYTEGERGDDSDPAVAIFDGVDRCVLESVFLPFLEPQGSGAVLRSKLWRARNYAIMGILSRSSMSLPVTRLIWNITDYHTFESSDSADRLPQLSDSGVILPGQVTRRTLEMIRPEIAPAGAWRAFASRLPSIRPSADTIRRADVLEHVLQALGVDEMARIGTVYRVNLVRDIAGCPEREQQHLFKSVPDSRMLERSVKQFQAEILKKEDRCTIP